MKQKRQINWRSIIMILLIFAFIVGAVIGVSQIFDFGSDDKNETKTVYVDVTHNVSYYENQSSSQVSEDDGNYSDSNLKVYNESYFNDKNKTKKNTTKNTTKNDTDKWSLF